MSAPSARPADEAQVIVPEVEAPTRTLAGGSKIFVDMVALLFALFQLGTAALDAFPNLVQRNFHVALALILCFALYPATRRGVRQQRLPVYEWPVLAALAASAVYMYLEYDRIIMAMADSQTWDLIWGTFLVLCLLEGARRTIGLLFPIITLIALLYTRFGNLAPGIWNHPGFSATYILENLYMTTQGVWGTIVGISATTLAAFVIFAALLVRSGGGEAFIDIAMLLAGRTYGGAAQVATIASALFGTISGSPVANVATTGAFTIPTMKRLGYRREMAAAVEAVASSGGQIAPPIMGAGAFLMAEFLAIPYLKIAAAAAIPAWLYFFGVGAAVHFEAKRVGLKPVAPDLMPKLSQVLQPGRLLPVLVPIAALLYFMFKGYTPATAAFWATVATIVLYLVTAGGAGELRRRFRNTFEGLISGGKGVVLVAVLIACAQITVSMISLSGVGVKLSQLILGASGGLVVLALILGMVVCIILGMGMPTTAAYVLAAAVVGPAFVGMGITPLSAHMFLFYYAILGAITPPVCVAVFVAAGMAQADWLKTAWIACRLGLAGFIVPFMFVYSPSLLLVGSTGEVLLAVASATLGVLILGAATMGYFLLPLSVPLRLGLTVTALLLIHPGVVTDLIGLGVTGAVWFWQWRARAVARQAAA